MKPAIVETAENHQPNIKKNKSEPNGTTESFKSHNDASLAQYSILTLSNSGESAGASKRRQYNRSQSLMNLNSDRYSAIDITITKERLLRTNPVTRTSALRNLTRKQKLTLTSLALVDFMSFCSMSIMAPFFPREAAEKGMNDITSGFVFSFYALVMFISSPIFGKILPLVGAKHLFMTGMFVSGICNLCFGILEYIDDYTVFTTLCFLMRGLEAVGASAYSTASYVFVVNTFPNSIGAVLGILETFVGLGMSTGPAIGGFLYSIGGFSVPFFVLGITMVLSVPINLCLLQSSEDSAVTSRSGSILDLIKVPSVVITGLVIVIVSNTWGFLDPTLEPHLRQFSLTPEQIGLIFLLFSGLYGISSPGWGWLADKVHHHWSMMVWGLLFSTIGLLLLGPSPLLPFLPGSLWLDLLALSILGISVALALLPTFQTVLTSALEGGCSDSLATYSVVAGAWSCMYALGEVLGPALGGVLHQHYGFPLTATVMAGLTFTLALITAIFFMVKDYYHIQDDSGSSDSGISGSWRSTDDDFAAESMSEKQSLLGMTDYHMYTNEKILYFGQSRKDEKEMGKADKNQVTDVRGTIGVTAYGACEV